MPLPTMGPKTAPVRTCVETHEAGDPRIFSLIALHPQGAALIRMVQVASHIPVHSHSRVKGKK